MAQDKKPPIKRDHPTVRKLKRRVFELETQLGRRPASRGDQYLDERTARLLQDEDAREHANQVSTLIEAIIVLGGGLLFTSEPGTSRGMRTANLKLRLHGIGMYCGAGRVLPVVGRGRNLKEAHDHAWRTCAGACLVHLETQQYVTCKPLDPQ